MHSFSHKTHSFGNNLDRAQNQKKSLTKVVQLDKVKKEMLPEDEKMQSFGHKLCIHLITD